MDIPKDISPYKEYTLKEVSKITNYGTNVIHQILCRYDGAPYRAPKGKIINLPCFLKVFYYYKPERKYKRDKVKAWNRNK